MLLPSSFFLQDQIAHMKNYIARFGHGSAKLARQAQSKEKTLAKMVAGGLTEKVKADRDVSFYFYSCGEIPPPVIMVQVRYTMCKQASLTENEEHFLMSSFAFYSTFFAMTFDIVR